VRGASARASLLAAAIVAGVVAGAATLPVQHHWLHLPDKHGGAEPHRHVRG
jgi:hypothetical protein